MPPPGLFFEMSGFAVGPNLCFSELDSVVDFGEKACPNYSADLTAGCRLLSVVPSHSAMSGFVVDFDSP